MPAWCSGPARLRASRDSRSRWMKSSLPPTFAGRSPCRCDSSGSAGSTCSRDSCAPCRAPRQTLPDTGVAMRRRSLVVAALGVVMVAVAGCKDAFSGHQDVVATAAGENLTVERVAAMIAPAKSVPMRREIVDRIADMWVDYELLAQAVAN